MEMTAKRPQVLNFINGDFKKSSVKMLPIYSPIDGSVISSLPDSTTNEVAQAVSAAKQAYSAWSSKTLKERVQYFFRYRSLLESHREELAQLIRLENGKTIDEARAEVDKSIELCEFAVSMPQVIVNEIQEVSQGVECRIERKPLGVVACITV